MASAGTESCFAIRTAVGECAGVRRKVVIMSNQNNQSQNKNNQNSSKNKNNQNNSNC